MFYQLSAEILPSLIKGRHNNTNTNNNKAKCIPGGTLRVLAGKNRENQKASGTRLKILPVLTREHYTSLLHFC
jgi:hypothetical protein